VESTEALESKRTHGFVGNRADFALLATDFLDPLLVETLHGVQKSLLVHIAVPGHFVAHDFSLLLHGF